MKKRTFDEWFADFVRYNENGNVKETYVTPEGNRLGLWARGIRQGKYRVTEEQRKRLIEAGFVWEVKSRRTFDEWFADFVRYNENGNVKVTYVTPEGYALGGWVIRIRAGVLKITEEQKKRLNEVGFNWKAEVGRTFEDWLVDFIRYNHNGNVAATYVTPEGNKLGRWVHNIRAGHYKLTESQKRLMAEVGFRWNDYRTFDEWLADFVRYNENGNVKTTYVTPEGNKLGQWVRNIRTGIQNLTEEQRNLLAEAGFKWKAKEFRTFDEWFADFVRYNENGNVKQRYVTPEGNRLGHWVDVVRRGRCKLTKEQKEILVNAGFKWKVKSGRTFDEWFADFVSYNKNGDVQQTYVTPEGNRLGNWVKKIRKGEYEVTEEQRKRLIEAGFVWEVKSRRTFDEWFADFVRYNENGNVKTTYVTPEGNRLGSWVNNVRAGTIKLTDEQRKRMNDVGFVWQAKRGRSKRT